MEGNKVLRDSKGKRLRRLLPAEPPESQTEGQTESTEHNPLPRRTRQLGLTKAACVHCQKRKSKCSGERPKCTNCVARNAVCEYNTSLPDETHSQALKRKYEQLQESSAAYQEIYELLHARASDDVAVILQHIKSAKDPEVVLRRIKDGDLLLQITLEPETRHRYVFPYSKELPPFLQHPGNPYLSSLVYEWILEADPAPSEAIREKSTDYESIYLKPYHAASVIDPFLGSVKPSEWTSVACDDDLTRQLLDVYFRNEHLWLVCFHKDYFLMDMAAGRHRFCSPLLVNAVLASAVMSLNVIPTRYEYWNPERLGYKFLAEAKRLWEQEVEAPKITTAQAGMLLTTCYSMFGMDKIGWPYTIRAIGIARNMGLFTTKPQGRSEVLRRVGDFTAWALFNYQCLHSFAWCDAPLMLEPPAVPMPDPVTDPAWFGEVWLQYPARRHPYSAHLGLQFKTTSELRVIMNEICVQCFAPAMVLPLPPERVDKFVLQLKHWYDSLPQHLLPTHIVLPCQLMLHMSYQSVLASFNIAPLSADANLRPDRLVVEGMVADASRNLETLIRLYYLRHGFDVGDKSFTFMIGRLAFAALDTVQPDATNRGDAKSTIFLAVVGLREASESFYFAHLVLRLLRMQMSSDELELISPVRNLPDIPIGHERELKNVYSRWPTGPIGVAEHLEAQRLCNLAKLDVSLYTDEERDSTTADSL